MNKKEKIVPSNSDCTEDCASWKIGLHIVPTAFAADPVCDEVGGCCRRRLLSCCAVEQRGAIFKDDLKIFTGVWAQTNQVASPQSRTELHLLGRLASHTAQKKGKKVFFSFSLSCLSRAAVAPHPLSICVVILL